MTLQLETKTSVEIANSSKRTLVRKLFWWVLILPAVMCASMVAHSLYWLNLSHVLAGTLWTGTDIFMGFFLGPVLRRLNPNQRTAVIQWLTPKTMLYLPVLAFTTGTAGWYLANWLGMLEVGNPSRPWIYGALVVITILAVSGFGFLLPNSIRTYLELQKKQPNTEHVFRLNRRNNVFAGVQGVFQILIILIMSHLAMG
jgi:hypothetical protein